MKANIIDISDWIERPLNTEGTRDKSVLISPHLGGEYYFKTSLMKERKNYTFEFWSEIIASKVGAALGFNIADYNVGIRREDNGVITVGALVASVHNEGESLVSGYNLVVQHYSEFSKPEIYKNKHSIELIRSALYYHGLENNFYGMLECMVFDAIIGNTDRHSENWAFIANKEYLDIQQSVKNNIDELPDWSENQLELALKLFADRLVLYANPQFMKLAPLYDNGSSLGREINEPRIKLMVQSSEELERYITKGNPDIKVREHKTTFLEAMECLCDDYPEEMMGIITRLNKLYDKEQIVQLISLFDQVPELIHIPQELRLSKERKQFITTVITERIERIINIGNRICAKQ